MDLEFRTQLIAFLRACGCPDERLFALLRGVFFRGLRVRLVGSVARVLRGKKMSEFGHLRLRAILQSLGEYYAAVRVDGGVWSGCVKCDAVKRAGKGGDAKRSGAVNSKPTNTKESNTEVPLPLLSLCSSIGSPYKNWLCSVLRSCHGGRALPPTAELSRCLEVVFPTEQFVRRSGESGSPPGPAGRRPVRADRPAVRGALQVLLLHGHPLLCGVTCLLDKPLCRKVINKHAIASSSPSRAAPCGSRGCPSP